MSRKQSSTGKPVELTVKWFTFRSTVLIMWCDVLDVFDELYLFVPLGPALIEATIPSVLDIKPSEAIGDDRPLLGVEIQIDYSSLIIQLKITQ